MTFEKKIAQIEQKKLFKKYETWVYPQSDLGVEVLSEAGFFTGYNLYYLDEKESEETRLKNAKDVALQALAHKFERFSHRNVLTKTYKIVLGGETGGYNRDLVEDLDYAIQITEVPIDSLPELSFDDIKAL